jgi:hypothetical protein
VGEVVVDVVVGGSVGAAMHEQADEMRADRGPFWFDLQASTAYVGMAVAATDVMVKVEQNDLASASRSGRRVARKARRQLSALQSAAAALPAARTAETTISWNLMF